MNVLGFDVFAEKHLIVDPNQLATKVELEPAFAEWAGWNRHESVGGNVRRHMDTNSNARLDGFLLGYPECAVRYMSRLHELASRAISAIGTFDPTGIWSQEDTHILLTLSEHLHQPCVSVTDINRLHEEVYTSNECRDLYRRCVPQASEEDYALLASKRTGLVYGPWTTEVYSFAIHASDLNQAKHRALQTRVSDGFSRHGFGVFLSNV